MTRGCVLILPMVGMLMAGCQHGCTGFSGAVDDVPFDPNGTVFSYVDAHDEALTERSLPPVVVAMTWIVFNPAADLAELSGQELEEMRHEMALRDALSLVFPRRDQVDAGARFVSVLEGGVEQETDGLRAFVHFAPERLNAQSTYASFRPFGSRRTVEVDVDTVEFDPGLSPGLSGRVSIEIEQAGDDPDDARTGLLEGTFTAPLVEERAAEHNLGLLEAQALIGLPLLPSDEPDR